MECPVCKNDCESSDRFCRNCGANLAEEQPQGRFRPLFQKAQDPATPWYDYVVPFFLAALWFCLGLLALAGIVFGIEYLLRSN
jgi:hypothetical protein